MSHLPHTLYRADQVRALDRIAIEGLGIPGGALMAQAGLTAYAVLHQLWPDARRITVFAGAGNNGGDGFLLARNAYAAGIYVDVYLVGDPAHLRGDALAAMDELKACGVVPEVFQGDMPQRDMSGTGDVVVDALFGTGLDRVVEGVWLQAIKTINDSRAPDGSRIPVFSLDIPSGLHADSGRVLGAAVKADATISFIGLKQGLFTGQGPEYAGRIVFSDLQVPPPIYQQITPAAERLSALGLERLLTGRSRVSHKGSHGHVLLIGGDVGMAGATCMAAMAAARVGAGLVSIATRGMNAAAMAGSWPELMVHAVEAPADLKPLFTRATVIAIGMGLGQSDWGKSMLVSALDTSLPLIVDADGLNLLSAEPQLRHNWVLTPHPGEAGRLLATSSTQIELDRFKAVSDIQARYGGTSVLKGAGTLVCSGDGSPNGSNRGPIGVCDAGNPGMATGGMGDVLSGVIAGLHAQGIALSDAARLGVLMHAQAGDLAARDGERGMVATDLLPFLRQLANPGLNQVINRDEP